MPTRRNALKTLAGATVVGSLSGCIQLATQRTVEYHGTPAMLQKYVPNQDREGTSSAAFASAVGIEAHKTVERFGVTKEIVTHNWGMLYSAHDFLVGSDGLSGTIVATFTTPSIKIAGQELNPIKDLTVGDIGQEFASTVRVRSVGHMSSFMVRESIDDATGRKVLRAFQDAVGGGNKNIEHSDSWTAERTVPSWDGDTYDSTTLDGKGNDVRVAMRFDKHDGDFVVKFFSIEGDTEIEDVVHKATFTHPSDDEFNEEMLQRHLIETNLAGLDTFYDELAAVVDDGAMDHDKLKGIATSSRNLLGELYGPAGHFNTSSSKSIQLQLDAIDKDLESIREEVESLGQHLDRLSRLVETGKEQVAAEDFEGAEGVIDDVQTVLEEIMVNADTIVELAENGHDHVTEAHQLVEDAEGADAETARQRLLDGLDTLESNFGEIRALADNYNTSLSHTF